MFSGGALEQLSIIALGIMPYISSSIILQLLTVVIPTLERLQNPRATVEDAAETALLLYDFAARVPNLPPGDGGLIDWMSIAIRLATRTTQSRR